MPGKANIDPPVPHESAEEAKARADQARELAAQAQAAAVEAAREATEIAAREQSEAEIVRRAAELEARYTLPPITVLACNDCGIAVTDVPTHESLVHEVKDWRTVSDPLERQRLRRLEMDRRRARGFDQTIAGG